MTPHPAARPRATPGFSRREFLALAGIGAAAWLAPRLLAAGEPPPNFVFVLGEGQGWSATSVQMDDAVAASRSGTVATPNLERLAREGMRFSRFYAPSPRCTPSRAALLTGRSPAALHMTFVGEGRPDESAAAGRKLLPPSCLLELPEGETTIAELLKRAGYATAHFGKWHLGRRSPSAHGFDEHDGPNNNGGPENVENPNPKQAREIAAKGAAFMARQAAAGRPFFLQVSQYGRHNDPSAFAVADESLGALLKAIDELGIAGRTYVIYTTDHGSPGRNPPLAGGKGTIWEGGLRVPCVVRGPGVRAGASCPVRSTGVDLLPTIAELAGVTRGLPTLLEGGSLSPLLSRGGEGAVVRPREEFVVHFPHYDKDPLGPASAIWLGEFKLVRHDETGARRLYQLDRDPGERNDLAAAMPDKVAELDRRLSDCLAAVHAQATSPNPAFNPSTGAAPFRRR